MGTAAKSAPTPDKPPPAPKFGTERAATQRVYEMARWGVTVGGMVTPAERTLPGAA